MDQTLAFVRQHVLKDNVRLQIEILPELTQGFQSSQTGGAISYGFKDIDSLAQIMDTLVKSRGGAQQPHKLPNIGKSPESKTQVENNKYIEANKLYKFAMFSLHPETTLLLDSLGEELHKFKRRLADDLNNANQYFKKLGFSRKKNVDMLDMQNRIMHHDGDNNLSNEIFDYVAMILKVTIVVIDVSSALPKRIDFEHGNDTYLVINTTDVNVIEFKTTDEVKNYMKSVFKTINSSSLPRLKQTVPYLKEVAKFLGHKSVTKLTKDALLNLLFDPLFK